MLRPTRQLNTQPFSEGEDGGERRRVKRLRRKKKKEAAVVKRKVPGSVLLIACVLVIITAFSRLHNRRGPKDSSLRRSSFSVPDSKLRNMNNGIAKEDSLPLDSIYRTSFPVVNRPGDDFSLSQLMGKVSIVINVASH